MDLTNQVSSLRRSNADLVLRKPRELSNEFRSIKHIRVYDVVGWFTSCGLEHALGHGPPSGQPDVGRRGRPVRRQDDVVQLEQGVLAGERLDLEHVEAGTG